MAVHRIDYKHFPINMYEKMDESFFCMNKNHLLFEKKNLKFLVLLLMEEHRLDHCRTVVMAFFSIIF